MTITIIEGITAIDIVSGGGAVSSVNGETGAVTLLFKPQIVTTRGTLANFAWPGTEFGRTDIRFESRNVYPVGCQNVSMLQIGQPGFIISGTGETALTNDYYWESAFEIDSPVTYNSNYVFGANLATILNNCPLMITDPPTGYNIAAGGYFYVRQSVSINNINQFMPVGAGATVTNFGAGDQGYLSASTTSQIQGTGSLSAPSGGASANNISPALILGVPVAPMAAVIIVGDSIADGTGDVSDGNGNEGFIQRGLWNSKTIGSNTYATPWAKQTVGGWSLFYNTVQYSPNMRTFWRYCTHIINELGNNDPGNGITFSAIQTFLTNLWRAQKTVIGPYGKPLGVAQCLLFPRTTSTDSWATAANQTAVTNYGIGQVRDQVNAWILTQVGNGILDIVIDLNQYVEDPSNHGKWLTNGVANHPTADGIHPSSAFHILCAQAVNTWAAGITP